MRFFLGEAKNAGNCCDGQSDTRAFMERDKKLMGREREEKEKEIVAQLLDIVQTRLHQILGSNGERKKKKKLAKKTLQTSEL